MPCMTRPGLTLSEAQHVLRVGYATLRRMIESGDLRVVEVGRRVRVPRAEIERLFPGEGPR